MPANLFRTSGAVRWLVYDVLTFFLVKNEVKQETPFLIGSK